MKKSSFGFSGKFSSKQKNANIIVSEITNDLGKIVILKYDDCISNEPKFPRHFWKLSIRSNISNIKSSLSKVLLYRKKIYYKYYSLWKHIS